MALSKGDAASAIDHLLQAFEHGEASCRVHYALARAYRRLGKAEEAARHQRLFTDLKREEETRKR